MIPKKFFSLLIISTFLFALAGEAAAQQRKRRVPPPSRKFTVIGSSNVPEPPPVVRDLAQQRRYETFLLVWGTINENYFDPTFGGLDWQKLRGEYTVRVDKTTTDSELHEILQEMIARLNKSHFTIVPPEVFRAIDIAKTAARAKERADRAGDRDEDEGGEGDTSLLDELLFDENAKYGLGLGMRLMNDQFVVTNVREGSSAQKAGIRPGFVVEKVNGVSLNELLKKVEAKYARAKSVKKMLGSEIVRWMLNGEKDSEVTLAYLNEKDELKESKIVREKLSGETVSLGENFPEQYLNFEMRSLDANTGYVHFDVFAIPVIEKFCTALTAFKDKKALIIDLRGNHGGLFSALMGVSGMLTDSSMEIGTQVYKVGSERMMASRMKKNFKGRLIFLVDELSLSSSEVMAAAMQESGRATIVGEKTGGEALPALTVTLPTGAVFIYPAANFKTPKGKYIEGVGVTPDITVAVDRKTLLSGKDIQLEAALKAVDTEIKVTPPPPPVGIHLAARDSNAKAPPPPPPAAAPPPPALRPLVVQSANASTPRSAPAHDQKSTEVIESFIKAAGGRDALKKIVSYSLKGLADIEMRGMTNRTGVAFYRGGPGKYSEIVTDEALGEVREIFTKDNYQLQTAYGYLVDYPVGDLDRLRDVLQPIFKVTDLSNFNSLTYSGIFDREGRKTHVISGTGLRGEEIALVFDVETSMLVSYVGASVSLAFADYRKVNDILLPHNVDRSGVMKMEFFEITVNGPVDEANFTKKINCFDKPD